MWQGVGGGIALGATRCRITTAYSKVPQLPSKNKCPVSPQLSYHNKCIKSPQNIFLKNMAAPAVAGVHPTWNQIRDPVPEWPSFRADRVTGHRSAILLFWGQTGLFSRSLVSLVCPTPLASPPWPPVTISSRGYPVCYVQGWSGRQQKKRTGHFKPRPVPCPPGT